MTRRAVKLPLVTPIVPVLRDQPFDDPAYLFEPKYDADAGMARRPTSVRDSLRELHALADASLSGRLRVNEPSRAT